MLVLLAVGSTEIGVEFVPWFQAGVLFVFFLDNEFQFGGDIGGMYLFRHGIFLLALHYLMGAGGGNAAKSVEAAFRPGAAGGSGLLLQDGEQLALHFGAHIEMALRLFEDLPQMQGAEEGGGLVLQADDGLGDRLAPPMGPDKLAANKAGVVDIKIEEVDLAYIAKHCIAGEKALPQLFRLAVDHGHAHRLAVRVVAHPRRLQGDALPHPPKADDQ